MKRFLFFIFLSFYALTNAQELNWFTDFEEAKKEAKSKQKPILMYITGSDWCSPCKQLKKDFFSDESFIKKSEGVVLLMVDLPFREDIITPEQKVKNKKLEAIYNPEKSYPLLIGFTSTGSEIDRISGYSGIDTSYHFTFLDKLLNI